MQIAPSAAGPRRTAQGLPGRLKCDAAPALLLLDARVLVTVLILVARHMAFVIMMLFASLLLAGHRRVSVAVLINVAWRVPLVVVMRSRCRGRGGWLAAHVEAPKKSSGYDFPAEFLVRQLPDGLAESTLSLSALDLVDRQSAVRASFQ